MSLFSQHVPCLSSLRPVAHTLAHVAHALLMVGQESRTFNSLDSTPENLSIEAGEPIKQEPWGTGKGKRDGSQALPSKFMAGCSQSYEYIDLMTSGHITAFASKEGLSDSLKVVSDEFVIAGR